MSTFFFEEIILCCYIIIGLFISCLTKVNKKSLGDSLLQKKIFFFLCRLAIVTLLATFITIFMSLGTLDSLFYGEYLFQNTTMQGNGQLAGLPGFGLMRKDPAVQFFSLIANALIIFYFFLMNQFLKTRQQNFRYSLEVPVLLITIFLSLKIFLMATDLILLILTVELAAFCSIILLGLQTTTTGDNLFAIEAAVKYFIFNAVGVAFLLFATNGYFALFGSTNLLDIGALMTLDPWLLYLRIDFFLVIHGIFFLGYLMKLGAAPLHQWVPDVYEGAELIITALLVLVVGPVLNFKFFILIKALLPLFEPNHLTFLLFLITGFLSLLIGSFNAFSQIRIKRFLAYAGITHLGFILISFGTASLLGIIAALFYLIFYIITNLVFFSLLLVSRQLSGVSLIFLNQLKLLVNHNPFLFFFFFIPLFSYAGFPPFAGFFTKFFALFALVDLNHFFLLIAIILLVVFSAYLYLRFIKIMVFEKGRFRLFLSIEAPTKTAYYSINNFYQQIKHERRYTPTLFFLLFFLNILIIAFIYFLPILFLSFVKPIIALVLFY